MRQSDSLILSAVDAMLYPSFALGAHGAVAAILSAAPAACVALWDAVARGDHRRALDLHGRLLSLWNAIDGDNLPACVKCAQSLQGLPRGPCRGNRCRRLTPPSSRRSPPRLAALDSAD